MQRLNTIGQSYLEIKEAITKEERQSVKNALIAHIKHLTETEVIKPELASILTEDTETWNNTRLFLERDADFCKTELELTEELTTLSISFQDELQELLPKLDEIDDEAPRCQTKPGLSADVNTERLSLSFGYEFFITKSFLNAYFDISSDEVYNELSIEKGFIAKFAILRLNKIMADFQKLERKKKNRQSHARPQLSNVFNYDDVFGVTCRVSIPAHKVEDESIRKEVLAEVSELLTNMKAYFEERMKI